MSTRFSLPIHISIGGLAVLAFFAASPASAQVWRSVGLTGGDVRALAIDPHHSNVLYKGTTDGHIFGSVDAGATWKLLGLAGPNSNAVVTNLIVDPRIVDSQKRARIYASTWTRET